VALLGLAGLVPAQAGQLSVPFTVKVTLATDTTGICRSTRQIGVFGTAVTIDCASGAPATFSGDASTLPWATVPDGLFRYLIHASDSGQWLGSVESRTGPGIVTSWNVVRLPGFEYLELMVTW
jgi:hypothetical protein